MKSTPWRRDLNHGTKQISERSEEHTSELQSHSELVCRLLLEKKKKNKKLRAIAKTLIPKSFYPITSLDSDNSKKLYYFISDD